MVMQAFTTFFASSALRVTAGQIFPDDHPTVARYPAMFVMLDDDGTGVPLVETAERQPGQMSFTRRPG